MFLISAFQIIGALSERAQQMRPPSNAAFTTADPRADGQADSVRGGHAGRPVPEPASVRPALPGVFGGARGCASDRTLDKNVGDAHKCVTQVCCENVHVYQPCAQAWRECVLSGLRWPLRCTRGAVLHVSLCGARSSERGTRA